MTNIHAELVCAGSGLHANSQNADFKPGREVIAKWAALMFAGAHEIAQLSQELEKLRAARFEPLGDNHHNAAECPYCSPRRESEPERAP